MQCRRNADCQKKKKKDTDFSLCPSTCLYFMNFLLLCHQSQGFPYAPYYYAQFKKDAKKLLGFFVR